MTRARALTVCLIALAFAIPSVSLAAECWHCAQIAVCFPGGNPGRSICTTSCCPNKCQLSGLQCVGAPPPSEVSSQSALHGDLVQSPDLAASMEERLVVVSVTVR